MFNDKKYNSIVGAITKLINTSLEKAGIDYSYSPIISELFNGEGFYIANYERAICRPKIWGYDIHWAYGGALLNDYPLSNNAEVYNGKNKTSLGFFICKFTRLTKRYKNYDYTLFLNKVVSEPKNKNKYIMLFNFEYEIFKDMYDTDVKIIKKYYFQQIGKLPFADLVEKYYKKKKESEDCYKCAYEAGFYGKLAQNFKREEINEEDKPWQKEEKFFRNQILDMVEKTYKIPKGQSYKLRDRRCIIASLQTAYTRHKEWQVFKKYEPYIVYMNTDSVHFNNNVEFETSDAVGHYGIEYNGDTIQYIRRAAYIVLNNTQDKVIKSKIGGVINDELLQNIDTVNKLFYGQCVKANTYESEEHRRNDVRTLITLAPLYFEEYTHLTDAEEYQKRKGA